MPFYTMPDKEKLYVRQIGKGKPVLILSGLGMSSWQWLPYLIPSLKHRSFYIPDYRGFGQSKHCKIPTQVSAIESHWSDLQNLISQLNIEKFDVIAYSMGATTTMHGLKYGNFDQYIDQYLHIDQTTKIRNDQAEWQYGLFGREQTQFLQIIQTIYDFLHPLAHYKTLNKLPQAEKKQLTNLWLEFIHLQGDNAFLQRMSQSQLFQQLQTYLLPLKNIDYILWYLKTYLQHQEDYRQTLINFVQPTTFFIGKHSQLYSYHGQLAIAHQMQQAKIYVFNKSGHAPLMNQPFKFTYLLNHFLKNKK